MGAEGLTRATQVAILNANYIAHRPQPHFPVLYTGRGGLVAPEWHVCLLYTSDAGDERSSVDLGGRRILKKKTHDRHRCEVRRCDIYRRTT